MSVCSNIARSKATSPALDSMYSALLLWRLCGGDLIPARAHSIHPAMDGLWLESAHCL